jgi:hypothetical protein
MEESEMERVFSFVLFSLLSYFLLESVEAERKGDVKRQKRMYT